MSTSSLCLGYTSYRLETLAYIRPKMQSCQCIVLEEPPTPGFKEMLNHELDIDEYLLLTDFGFPGFAHALRKVQRVPTGLRLRPQPGPD